MNGLLNDLGLDRSELLRHTHEQRYVEAFRVPNATTWADVAAFCCLIDRVGRFQIEEMVGSSYQPLDKVLPQIIHEELGHVGYGTARLAELAATPETRAEAQAYVEWGLKHRLNEEARADYLAEVKPILAGMELAVPDEDYDRRYV